MVEKLSSIPDVIISQEVVQKYILARIGTQLSSKLVLRSGNDDKRHTKLLEDLQIEVAPLLARSLGGGIIEFDPEKKLLRIGGSSKNLGAAEHNVAAELVKSAYPEYYVEFST